jgi:predicted  nucleic acid-binding Zn-ribbon protein
MDSKTLIDKLVKLQNIDLEIKVIKQELSYLSFETDSQRQEMEVVIKQMTSDRDALCESIGDKVLVSRIAKLQSRYRGLFLAPVVDSVCRGCRMTVPASLMVHLINADALVYCENCGRILRKIDAEKLLVKPPPPPPAPKRGRKPKKPPTF